LIISYKRTDSNIYPGRIGAGRIGEDGLIKVITGILIIGMMIILQMQHIERLKSIKLREESE